jgi:N-acetylglucosaminyl-diphospho-decaprenol L-rhamnosyltransferase
MDAVSRDLQIAVIIVSYRTAQLTIEALRSVAHERATPGMCIRAVVVDNSSEDLPSIAEAVASNDWSTWVSLIASPRNGGYGYGNNLGLAQAWRDGPPDYVYLLNPDAQVRSGAIATLVRFLESRADVGIAGGSFQTLDGHDWPIAFRFPSLWSEIDAGLSFGLVTRLLRRWVVARAMSKSVQPTDWVCGASMLIRPSVLAAIGGFDENYFLYFEETDFCYRARKAGFSTWYVPDSCVMHVGGQSTAVTSPDAGSRRRPPYWFASRRRYFAVTFGLWHAMLIDVAALLANSLGFVKRVLLGRRRTAVSHFTRDLLRHSVLWPRNRKFPALRCFTPPS